MLDLLTARVLLWVCALLSASIVIIGAFAGCEHRNAAAARTARDAYEVAANTAYDANKTNFETIEAYKKSNAALAALTPKPGDVAKQLAQLQAEIDELNRQDVAYARAKETDRADPNCDALLRTDLERVCPTVTVRLRRAAGGD